MRKLKFIALSVILTGALFYSSNLAFADGLIIHDGATLTLNDATLDLNCLDLTIDDGGIFDLGSGTVEECGVLQINNGGDLIWGTGEIDYCQNFKGDGGSCFITTAAYESSTEPHVMVFHEFIDRFMLNK